MTFNQYHTKSKKRQRAIKNGYNSGLEEDIAKKYKIKEYYEIEKIDYIIPESEHHYTPDFSLPNGIIIETKGRFTSEDRKKHLLIKKQHPELDIRFLFKKADKRIKKGSNTTCADWCNKHGFKYCEKEIPKSWLKDI